MPKTRRIATRAGSFLAALTFALDYNSKRIASAPRPLSSYYHADYSAELIKCARGLERLGRDQPATVSGKLAITARFFGFVMESLRHCSLFEAFFKKLLISARFSWLIYIICSVFFSHFF